MDAILNNWLFIPLVTTLVVIALFPLVAGYIVLIERKILADFQVRLGPMRVGRHGVLQPLADALKLLLKEDIVPADADKALFWFAPVISTFTGLSSFAVLPLSNWLYVADVNVGILVILARSSVGILGIILGGWSSISHYPLLGALRSAAQLVSYEVALSFALLSGLMVAGTLSMQGIIKAQQERHIWFIFENYCFMIVPFVVYIIAATAETNRAPFDLPEAESELVAGFHTEYSGFRWSLFFMAEYAAMVVVTAVATTLYLGGWYFPFVYRLTEAHGYHDLYVVVSLIVFLAKAGLLLYLYFWLRWTLPRFRYDQLMDLGWKWMLPAALINIVVTAIGVTVIQGLDGWNGMHTIRSMTNGLALTPSGKTIAIGFGFGNLFLTAGILSLINWRSRAFNLKKQRRQIRLVDLPKGRPAVMPVSSESAS